MGRILKSGLVPLLVMVSLLAAPTAVSDTFLSIDHCVAAHHHEVGGDARTHDECATVTYCLLAAPDARQDISARAGDPIAPLILPGEQPRVPAPPPRQRV